MSLLYSDKVLLSAYSGRYLVRKISVHLERSYSGGDTGLSVRIELPKIMANYQTTLSARFAAYYIPDRARLYRNGELFWDTGYIGEEIGAAPALTKDFTFPQGTNNVDAYVNVMPGYMGTAWGLLLIFNTIIT